MYRKKETLSLYYKNDTYKEQNFVWVVIIRCTIKPNGPAPKLQLETFTTI